MRECLEYLECLGRRSGHSGCVRAGIIENREISSQWPRD